MPKIKVPRKSTIVDMTAMCDVAFLLLTFFILTAKFRPTQLVPIDIPTSRAEKNATDDILTISVDKEGKAYLGINIPKRRTEILDKIIAKYGDKYPNVAAMTPAQKMQFANLEIIGVPTQALPQIVGLKPEQLQDFKFPGIPKDTTENQLGEWIMAARYAYAEDDINKLKFAIKGDKTSNIKAVQRVIEVLREKDVYSFNIITSLEGNND
ncbi:MAG: biopolymer transporter ExbD [Chitinophagales bacterium]